MTLTSTASMPAAHACQLLLPQSSRCLSLLQLGLLTSFARNHKGQAEHIRASSAACRSAAAAKAQQLKVLTCCSPHIGRVGQQRHSAIIGCDTLHMQAHCKALECGTTALHTSLPEQRRLFTLQS